MHVLVDLMAQRQRELLLHHRLRRADALVLFFVFFVAAQKRGKLGADPLHEVAEEEQEALVGGIREDADWLLHMVENLLTVTRIDADTASVSKTEEPVEEVVAEAVARLKKRLPGVSVKVEVPDDFYMIPMDATLIEQVIINLLENAARHSGSSEPVELKVWPDGHYMRFDVVDYGKGIEPERLASIFDGEAAYSRAGSSEAFKGMGIGLSICKTIISAHKGTITAENHGRGAKFSFTLPMAPL